jgi:lysozyme
MIDRARLRQQLAKHEGFRPFVYDDATGKPVAVGSQVRGKLTVGVGRNLEDKGLSEDEIEYLLDNDISDCIGAAQTFQWFGRLDPIRQAVIVELIFNLGLTRFKGFKKFIQFASEGRWMHAAEELKNSLWYEQVKGRGETLRKQFLTGEWQ